MRGGARPVTNTPLQALVRLNQKLQSNFDRIPPGVTYPLIKPKSIDDVPILALHLTRPAIEIPDRQKLGMPCHTEAAKGAYVIRDYQPGKPQDGTFFVQGTSAMANLVKILPDLEQYNLKLVYVSSDELFERQPKAYQDRILTPFDKKNSTVITTRAKMLMNNWLFYKSNQAYALCSYWD